MSKKCCKCNNIKDYTLFSKNKSTKDGFAKQCKDCINNSYKNNSKKLIQISKKYYESHKEKIKKYKDEYYLENKEKLNKIGQKYYKDNKEEISKKSKKHREKNKDKIKESRAIYYENNKESIKEYQNQYRPQNKEKIKKQQKDYRKANLEKLKEYSKTYFINNKEKIYNYLKNYLKCNNVKIKCNLRSRVSTVIKSKGAKKSTSTMELIGCSIDFFIEYIEQKFTKNMSWDNYGKHGWHLDHIKPCSSFDLENEEEQRKCFHYTNYQPLWATTEVAIKYGENSNYIGNLEKHAKLL